MPGLPTLLISLPKPRLQAYNAIASDTRVFDPVKALDPLDEKFDWKAIEESPELDNVEDMIKDSKEVEKDRLEYRERKRK
jgi:hypothetical protein